MGFIGTVLWFQHKTNENIGFPFVSNSFLLEMMVFPMFSSVFNGIVDGAAGLTGQPAEPSQPS